MKKWIVISCLGLLVGIVSSCAPSTPQRRIQERPQDFEKLSEKHKELVSKGEIAKGMSKDAVYFAWGSPASQVDVFKDGKSSERWDYEGRHAVTQHRFYGGYSTGGYGPYGYSGYRTGIGPEVTYIPYRRASVWFVRGVVDEWERQR
jgi:hypothetical protein